LCIWNPRCWIRNQGWPFPLLWSWFDVKQYLSKLDCQRGFWIFFLKYQIFICNTRQHCPSNNRNSWREGQRNCPRGKQWDRWCTSYSTQLTISSENKCDYNWNWKINHIWSIGKKILHLTRYKPMAGLSIVNAFIQYEYWMNVQYEPLHVLMQLPDRHLRW